MAVQKNKKQWYGTQTNAANAEADFSANFTADWIPTPRYEFGEIMVTWSGAPVGDLKLESTSNLIIDDPASSKFVEIDTVSTSGITGHVFKISPATAEAYRIKYSSTSGTGSATVDVIWKGTGG